MKVMCLSKLLTCLSCREEIYSVSRFPVMYSSFYVLHIFLFSQFGTVAFTLAINTVFFFGATDLFYFLKAKFEYTLNV